MTENKVVQNSPYRSSRIRHASVPPKMPPNFFQKPETALKRAQELISVGKELDALETLHDTIKSKRHKQWTKTHEQIMLKHVELCVTLRRPHMAKDALFQYKALTQQVAVKSLETVIHHFLELAQQKTEEAQKTSIEKVEEIDDLDQADAPENLLLSAVSGAAAQDRMDRTVLSPWLRFLWDSYRNCLDLLRNNAVVEQLYHRIARQSFEFCAKFQRRTEFRKLCDHLRIHLSQIQKHQHLPHVVKLSSADSLTLMQDTRLIQLDTAIQMELWQEAYRSAEDVHGMMQLSKDKDKRMVKPASYVNYYDKLALVFWKAGNRLFHATALLQKFIIYKDMKKTFSAEEALEQATRVLLATLSIPDGADAPSDLTRHLDIEEQHIANMRLLSNLLRLPITPTRNGILKELVRLNIPEIANENARALYKLLECNFLPLRLAKEVQVELNKITNLNREDYNQYVDSIRTVTATKAIKQLSLIYETVSLDRITKVIPFYNGVELERFLVDIFKHRYVKAQIDHRERSIRFGVVDATLAGSIDPDPSNGFISRDAAQIGLEGIRGHLELMYNGLRDIVGVLDAEEIRRAALENLKRHVEVYNYHKNSDYERILLRRKKIENYKETSERMRMEKSQKAQLEAMMREEQKRAEEMRRLEMENAEKERLRKIAEQEEMDRKVRAEKMKKIQATPIYQAIVKDHGEEAFQNMDPESVLREQRDRLDEQRRELQARLQQQEKKFDHIVRAFHLEEIKVRAAMSAEFQRMAPIRHEEHEKHRVQAAIEEHERSVATYNRMQKVRKDAKEFLEKVLERHKDDFERKMEVWKQKLEEEKKKRLAKRHDQRKENRRQKWLAEREREAARAKEAEEQARREEKERERRAAKETVRREVESKSDMDTNWREGPRSQTTISARPPGRMTRGPGDGGDRFRERPLQSVSEADSGPWVHGNVVTAATRVVERDRSGTPTQRNIDRKGWESTEVSQADVGSWRVGEVVHKDGLQSRHAGDRRDEASENRPPSGRVVSGADSDNWRHSAGKVVGAPAQQQSGSKFAPSKYVPPHRARGGLGLGSGDRQPRAQAQTSELSSQPQQGVSESEAGGSWIYVPGRNANGSGQPPRRTTQTGGADKDRHWRKKN